MVDTLRRLLGQEPRPSRWIVSPQIGRDESRRRAPRRRFRRSMLINLPFLLGLAMVSALIIGAVFAPSLAPYNPYAVSINSAQTTPGKPPYPPSDLFPLGTDQFGRDMLSLLLYGASTTLIAAGAVTIARLLIGLTLGAIAGWLQDSLADRAIMSGAKFLAAFPILLAGMILILALDIRQGLSVFVVALSLVGWSELAQYIRAEFMRLKQQPFIESARAVGLSGFGIAVRHVLPNVIPSLIALLALEMGSVLTLLGELGFLSIFIGGGAFTQDTLDRTVVYANVPEWGAMLAGTRFYARTYPWLALAPATAFFLAVVGFNLLGEGFRRIIEESGINIALLISKRALIGVGGVVVALWFVRENTGPFAAYVNLTAGFRAERVIAETRTLTTDELAVRAPGSPGLDATAAYIARRFKELGLQSWGDNWETYFQVVNYEATEVNPPPRLVVQAHGAAAQEWVYRRDFRERLFRSNGPGQATGAGVTFLALNPQRTWHIDSYGRAEDPPLVGKNVVLILEENEPSGLAAWLRHRNLDQFTPGLLVATRDLNRIQRQGVAPINASMSTNLLNFDYRQIAEDVWGMGVNPTPALYITEAAADRLLATRGLTVAGLRERVAAMTWDREQRPADLAGRDVGEPFIVEPLPVSVTMRVEIAPVQPVTASNVIGFIPGTDTLLDKELIVVAAHYDSVSGAPGAVDNAASVATMLEIARLWQEQNFQPRRTVLFLAFPDGESALRGVERLRSYHTLFKSLRPVAFVQLDGLAGGSGDRLLIGDYDYRLHALASRAAGKLGVKAMLEHLAVVSGAGYYQTSGATVLGQLTDLFGPPHRYVAPLVQQAKLPTVSLRWEGNEDVSHRATDTVEALDVDTVSRAGRVLDLFLRVLARETMY